ncbi:MAG: M24 family metallopeptidase [Mesorhizobium sp.]|uniref:M24 family metallopeptidase n=1 Tax=Mesorhizobium sp. TaxID=1871066 RepID=UPI000FE2C6BF|nr:Xaa-Pro peptidase family protein [Mesorhizobium sp.]RWG80915.1 MAG: M24 family metallopeptidase [Mesorhizobium sp.]RWI44306.1 MAG: M24 family metallopeptidase [Mesorhizobium sp.]RWJ25272.1 MAG: M24 family metallopeptidase [Mesorhizobium sp.]RWJ89689.1 MAG: M24 family metallopeptidase [Mesorhizobium sp.]RWK15058.1 MAG: M24 family metallopeptidase [Mesorhizobium sp.]
MNLDKAPQAFPRAEYLCRLGAVKAEMALRGVDALVITDRSNITYLTGYTAKSAYVPQAVVISIQQEEPTFILRKMDAPAALHETFMARDKVIGYPEALVGDPDVDGYDAIIDFVIDVGPSNRGVGLEIGGLFAPSAEKFKARLPRARIVDCTGAVTRIRMVKSDLEISRMREAAAITDAGIMRASEIIRAGVREVDAVSEIMKTLVRGANGKPGTWLATPYFITSPRTGAAHITWTEDILRRGSQVNLEIAGVRHGYTAPMSRTFSIGRPSDRLRRVHEAQMAGLQAGLGAVRAGRTCHDVARAIYGTLDKKGIKKESRCGYPIGIDWMEKTASLKEGDLTVLKPNMTFHLHLGNWAIEEDFGYLISESIRVTESGVEVLTSAPRQLFELPSAA